jgi:vacuolar-type H+-ATPase subunit I/STV1
MAVPNIKSMNQLNIASTVVPSQTVIEETKGLIQKCNQIIIQSKSDQTLIATLLANLRAINSAINLDTQLETQIDELKSNLVTYKKESKLKDETMTKLQKDIADLTSQLAAQQVCNNGNSTKAKSLLDNRQSIIDRLIAKINELTTINNVDIKNFKLSDTENLLRDMERGIEALKTRDDRIKSLLANTNPFPKDHTFNINNLEIAPSQGGGKKKSKKKSKKN